MSVVRALTKLREEFDIVVTFDNVENDDGGDWDPLKRTLTINHHVDVGDMAFLLLDFWSYLTIGPQGSRARVHPRTPLYLVPDLRSHLDEATA